LAGISQSARLGHDIAVTAYTSVPNLLAAIDKTKPDVVFNLTDVTNGDRRKDGHICALLELMGVRYTGVGPRGLMLARDKATSKIIAGRAGFAVPRFLVGPPGPLQVPAKLPFPIVVKPRSGDASEGISGASLVAKVRRLADRIQYLRRRGFDDMICAEYISGKQVFVSALNDRIVRPKENLKMESEKKLEFKQLDSRAVLPTRGSEFSAGLDLYCIEEVSLLPGQRAIARTGLAVAVPEGYYGRVAPRSGLATKQGLDVLAGVIDADYRGEVGCLLYNAGDKPIILAAQSKICQLIVEKIITPEAVWVEDLSDTERGAGGFGSTG
jgi:dUTP pyrophosphatase